MKPSQHLNEREEGKTRYRGLLESSPGCEVMKLTATSARPMEVLLVEDSPGDVRLIQEALKDVKVPIRLHIARDGIEAMAFLRRDAKNSSAPRPDLILLDLNLPKKDGREVLREIKESATFVSIPVVILSTSASDVDIVQSYTLHANCYITKPVDLKGFLTAVKAIGTFWFSVVSLPHPAPVMKADREPVNDGR